MKHLQLFFFSLILFLPTSIFAHGPSRQKVVTEIDIDATPEKVWEIVKEFCSIKDWHPSITNCTANDGSEINSVRTISLENGESISEKLFKSEADKMRMVYAMEKLEEGRIISGLPVATLSTTIQVTDNNGKSTVQFKNAFYRAFPGQEPPPDQTDEACIAAVTKLNQTGLEGLKELAEQ